MFWSRDCLMKLLMKMDFTENETLAILHNVADQLIEIVKKEADYFNVGSFMYDKERLEYFYLKEPKDLVTVIENFYKEKYPEYKFFVNIKEDKRMDLLYGFPLPKRRGAKLHGRPISA